MSNINFLARLSNLLSGFVSLFIADVEKEHPEIAYENAINSLTVRYQSLQAASAAILRRRDDISKRVTDATAKLANVTQQLNAAVATNQDDIALLLIQQKNALEQTLADATGELQGAAKDADDAKSSLIEVKGEIKKLKEEKDTMLAKMQSAQAKLRINQQLDGLSVDAEVQTLDRVRDHIKNTISQANLSNELRDSDLDVRLQKLSQSSGQVNARAQLDAMKQARAGAAAQPVKQM